MDTRETVRQAWQLTQAHLKTLIWYGALPSFFVIVVSSAYLAYQYNAFRTSALFSDESHSILDSISMVWELVSDHTGLAIVLVILSIIFMFGYVIFPPMFRGVMIHAVNRIRKNQDITGSVESGIGHFFPMFEYGILTGAFGITTLFTESSLILRWWGQDAFFIALPFFFFVAIIGFIINFLFTYSEYYIILEEKGVIQSIKESSILVLANLRRTFLVFALLLLIAARTILNVLLVLLIPMLVVAVSTFFATKFLTLIAFVIVGLLSLIILLISAYLLGLFNIFTTAVWVLTFGLLRQGQAEPKIAKDEPLELQQS